MPSVAVCVKYVPDVEQVRVDKGTGRLIAEGAPKKMSDLDKNAVEEAVRIKEGLGWRAYAISVGPEEARMALREALAMGLDEAYLVCDGALTGLNTQGTALVLSKAIEVAGGADLVLCGEVSLDSFSGQVGPRLAELMNIPCITCARKLEVGDGYALAERALEDRYEELKARLPAVVTVTREINTPRIPSLTAIMRAAKKPVKVLSANDLGLSPEDIGPLRSYGLIDVLAPAVERKRIEVTGETADEIAEKLIEALERGGALP